MHRPKSLHYISTSTVTGSSEHNLDLLRSSSSTPYDNAKLKAIAIKGRLMPWFQPRAQPHPCVLVQLLLLVVVVGLWALHIQARYQVRQPRHLVVLDAGSTGTRVHVFQYAADSGSSYAAFTLPEPKLKVQPGLSAFADDAAGAAASLQPLLQFAAQHIPASQLPQTPVYLMATAGLRLLPAAAAEDILFECRKALIASDFLFDPDWAQTISGTYEGLYAWVAANYAAGHLQAAAEDAAHSRKDLHSAHTPFKALIEMGGASAQVTFMPDHQWHRHSAGSSKQRVRLKLPGVNHPLWAHSYLGYGFDVVQTKVDALVKQLAHANNASHHTSGTADHPTTAGAALGHDNASGAVEHSGARAHAAAAQPAASASAVHMGVDGLVDPCLPAGYHSEDGRVGSGVWQQCQQLVESVIDPSTCKPVNGKPCPEVPEHMPKLTGELLAIENFAYTATALSLPSVASLGEFATAARQFCSRPWPQTLLAHNQQEPHQQTYLWRYCFGSAFAWTLLHEVLHISEGQQLHFTNVLKRNDGAELGLDWALGAAVLQLVNNSAADGARLQQQLHTQQVLLMAAVAATAVLALCSAVVAQGAWRGGKLIMNSQHPAAAWLTVVGGSSGGSNGGAAGGGSSSSSNGGGTAAGFSSSWSTMASSAWANATSRPVKPAYQFRL